MTPNKEHSAHNPQPIKAGIVGGTGYTGVELVRLLSSHPQVTLQWLTSRSEAGNPVAQVFPSLRGVCDLCYEDFGEYQLAMMQACDVVFFATPHGVAMQFAQSLVASGVKVIDLAADFRLQSTHQFETWYKKAHTCPQMLSQSAYGLPEVNRHSIKTANIIGNPGCYPTTAILGLAPIIQTQNQALDPTNPTTDKQPHQQPQRRLIGDYIVIDAKSGVSGAGRQAELATAYAETTDNFRAYGVSGHRHLPEIEQGINQLLGSLVPQRVRFVPHLVPMIRGMFTTIHLQLTEQGCGIDWQGVFNRHYQHEPFIDVLPAGQLPDTRSVRASNRLRIAVHQDNDNLGLTVLVVQDNLVKGAAGQAVQNMNILFGFDETLGLDFMPIVP